MSLPDVKVETASGGEADFSSPSGPKGKIGGGEIRYLHDQIRRQRLEELYQRIGSSI
jgi:hypothetical protein